MDIVPSAALETTTPPLLQHFSESHNSLSISSLLSQKLGTGSSCQHTVYQEDHLCQYEDVGGCF